MPASRKILGSALALTLLLFIGWVFWHAPAQNPLRDPQFISWDLSQYEPVGKTRRIKEIENNLSGITFHPPSGQLYAISIKPREIHVLTRDGDWLRRIKLQGFRDTESISHAYDNVFFIAEEQRQNLVKIAIPDTVDTVYYEDATRDHLAIDARDNQGLEGVAWSDQYGLFAVQESPPTILYQPTVTHDYQSQLSAVLKLKLPVRDFAGLTILSGEHDDKLLILSKSSDSLHVVDMQGNELSRRSLRVGRLGLMGLFRQPEGVTVDDTGAIYIVGEPNQFLKLVVPSVTTSSP